MKTTVLGRTPSATLSVKRSLPSPAPCAINSSRKGSTQTSMGFGFGGFVGFIGFVGFVASWLLGLRRVMSGDVGCPERGILNRSAGHVPYPQ